MVGAFIQAMNFFRKPQKVILQLGWDTVLIAVSFNMQRRYIWHLLFSTFVNSEILQARACCPGHIYYISQSAIYNHPSLLAGSYLMILQICGIAPRLTIHRMDH
jgi:hypothetical protein